MQGVASCPSPLCSQYPSLVQIVKPALRTNSRAKSNRESMCRTRPMPSRSAMPRAAALSEPSLLHVDSPAASEESHRHIAVCSSWRGVNGNRSHRGQDPALLASWERTPGVHWGSWRGGMARRQGLQTHQRRRSAKQPGHEWELRTRNGPWPC